MKYGFNVNGVHREIVIGGAGNHFEIDGRSLEARWVSEGVLEIREGNRVFRAAVADDGDRRMISFKGKVYTFVRETGARLRPTAETAAHGNLVAPMPCLVTRVCVAEGDSVTRGQDLVVVEAMKTVQRLSAPFDGIVRRLPVGENQQVAEGTLLVEVAPLEVAGNETV